MNNFHIYEEVGRGKDSVVYKVGQHHSKFRIILFNPEFWWGLGPQEEKRRIRGSKVCREIQATEGPQRGKYYDSCFVSDMIVCVKGSNLSQLKESPRSEVLQLVRN